jgi:hypothetical protein
MQEDILDQNLVDEKHKTIFKIRPVIIWLVFLTIGLLFRILYWPGAGILILVSTAGLQAYCLNGFIKSKERNILNTILSILGLIWFVVMLGGIVFNNGHPYNIYGLGVYSVVFAIYFIIYYLIIRKKSRVNIR